MSSRGGPKWKAAVRKALAASSAAAIERRRAPVVVHPKHIRERREAIEADLERYLADGGEIQELPSEQKDPAGNPVQIWGGFW